MKGVSSGAHWQDFLLEAAWILLSHWIQNWRNVLISLNQKGGAENNIKRVPFFLIPFSKNLFEGVFSFFKTIHRSDAHLLGGISFVQSSSHPSHQIRGFEKSPRKKIQTLQKNKLNFFRKEKNEKQKSNHSHPTFLSLRCQSAKNKERNKRRKKQRLWEEGEAGDSTTWAL